jgi:XTP/dITP diphosphohydrolase
MGNEPVFYTKNPYEGLIMPPPIFNEALPDRIVIATHNAGKLREFADLLGSYASRIVSAGDLGLPSPEETGTTFAENALLKARAAAWASDSLTLADDSGLCVNALGGGPGLYSARWATPDEGFVGAMKRVLAEVMDAADRSAYFICVLALVWPNGRTETVEGRVNGSIATEMRGAGGHGYDAIFIPEGYDLTFAEMGEHKKNALSHRSRATHELVSRFFAG